MASREVALWERIKSVTSSARVKEAVIPIDTINEFREDRGIKFIISMSTALSKKPTNLDQNTKQGFNPFLPYNPDTFVGCIHGTHNLLLNKFAVIDYHLILATTDFQPQFSPLSESDFAALWDVIDLMSFIGFFNGGPLSGASQPHKHMQLMPPPHNDPIFPSFEAPIAQLIDKISSPPGEIFRIKEFTFKHSCLVLDQERLKQPNPEKHLSEMYETLLISQDLKGFEHGEKSYNFLMSRKWMLLVPRSVAKFGNIQINSIGFLGSILLKTTEDMEKLKEVGPMGVLEHVTFPEPKS